jgi:hypothetical protein
MMEVVMIFKGSPKDYSINTSNHESIHLQKTAFKSTPNSPAISPIDVKTDRPPTALRPLLPRAAIGADPVPADTPDKPDKPYHFFRPSANNFSERFSLLLLVDPASARR